MTTTGLSSSAPLAAKPAAAPSRRVVDAPTRVLHALLALSFVGAYVTGDSEHWRALHVMMGYTLAGALLARVAWGLFGPRPARLSMLWNRLRGALTALGSASGPLWQRARPLQNVALAASMVALLALVLPVAGSGFVFYQDWAGEWLGEVHEALAQGLLFVLLAHVALVLLLSVLRRRNLLTPMVTGRSPGPGPDRAPRNHGAVAAVLLAALLGFWAWQWPQVSAGDTGAGAEPAAWQSPKHADHDDDDD